MSEWLDAEQRIERAQQLSESHRWEEALSELDAAIAINPNNAAWHAHRGCVLEELDRLSDAAASYQQALDLEPGERDVTIALGVTMMRLNRFARAVELFEDLLKRHPAFEPAYCNLVHAYAELGEHEKAEETFYLGQQINEKCPHCFFSMGVSLAEREQFDRALFCWQRVLELEPGYMGVHYRIAEAYREKGDLAKAREFMVQALRAEPGNIDLIYELADLTLQAGRVAAAVAQFAQIVELEPDHIESHYALGQVWMKLGQHERALTCFEAIRTIAGDDPGLPDFHQRVGRVLQHLGRFTDARRAFHQAVKLDPADVPAIIRLGDCYLAEDRTSDATDWFRRVLALDARNSTAHHRLGICQLRSHRWEAGVRSCVAAIRLQPSLGPAMYNAAVGCLRLGRWKEARELLRRAQVHGVAPATVNNLRRRVWRFKVGSGLRTMERWLGLATRR